MSELSLLTMVTPLWLSAQQNATNASLAEMNLLERHEYTTPGPDLQGGTYSSLAIGFLALIIGLLALATIAGNTLVVISFATDRKLRSFGNYFILNLAISDLIVGVLIVVYAPYLLGGCWHLRRVGCLAFMLLDYVVPLVSAWNMALISVDRYWSVARPIEYRTYLNTNRVVACMFVPWFAGTLWYGPTVLFWLHLTGSSERNVEYAVRGEPTCLQCQVDFFDHAVYLLISSFVEFLLPFIIVTTINVLIYLNIRRRTLGLTGSSDCQKTAKAKSLLSRDKKSARSLAILVVVFLITWGPFEICSFVNPLCGFSIPSSALDVVFWLLWLNSTINPALYPFLQQRFRIAFTRILCRFKRRRVPRMTVDGCKTNAGDRSERCVAMSNVYPIVEYHPTSSLKV